MLEIERDTARTESENYKQMRDSEADSAVQSRTVKQQLEYQVGVLESQVRACSIRVMHGKLPLCECVDKSVSEHDMRQSVR